MVELKRPPVTRFASTKGNYVRFRLGPQVEIAIGVQVKKKGEGMISEPTELSLVHWPAGDEMGAYERLLGDAMEGDPALFTRQDAVEAAWRIVDPILGNVTPVLPYEPKTWGPKEADRLVAGIGGWACTPCDE